MPEEELAKKIESANEIIKEALQKGIKPVILFSGGKDSTVVLDLVRRIAKNTPAMFNNTGVEARETIQYVSSVVSVLENKPQKTFWECCKKWGFPTTKASNKKRHGNMCCKVLKEEPGD